MLEVYILEVGTVLDLGKDGWQIVKWLRQPNNEYPASIGAGTHTGPI